MEIFEPYISIIILLITIVINVLLVIIGTKWYYFIVANVLLMIISSMLGFTPVNIMEDILNLFIDSRSLLWV